MKRTPIGKVKRRPIQIRRISAKKKQQIKDEVGIRIALCQRAGGTWVVTSSITGGYCSGGICEICGKPPDWRGLHPHHTGIGASRKPLSLEDKMACGKCHSALHLIYEH